jgi:magnesium chelatase family protein
MAARAIQQTRGCNNALIPTRLIRKYCALDEAGERTLEMAVRRMGLSARAHDRILKLARTIADLDQSESVSAKHNPLLLWTNSNNSGPGYDTERLRLGAAG